MNREQAAYIKGVAHSIESFAEQIRQCAIALQRNNLETMPIELVELNFKDVSEPCQHIQNILSEIEPNMPQEDTNVWNVYYENADTDEPKHFIGTIEAPYEGKALELASEFYEHPSYDLIVKRSDLDTEHKG